MANKTRVIRFLVIYALVGYLACRQSHFVARIVIVCYFSFFFFSSFIICCVLIKNLSVHSMNFIPTSWAVFSCFIQFDIKSIFSRLFSTSISTDGNVQIIWFCRWIQTTNLLIQNLRYKLYWKKLREEYRNITRNITQQLPFMANAFDVWLTNNQTQPTSASTNIINSQCKHESFVSFQRFLLF